MFPKPQPALVPNTYAYESEPLVKATGFREYDARWLLGEEINLMGVQALGLGLGTLLHELGAKPEIVTAHDYRSYSASVKLALVSGLMAAGCRVHDIGLAVTPMAYFAQFALDVPCVAMVTASHNDNGWTGVKMGANRPLTFGPDEMTALEGHRAQCPLPLRAAAAPTSSSRISRPATSPISPTGRSSSAASRWSAPAATAPPARSRRRCWPRSAARWCRSTASSTTRFPRYNPNTEDLKMLHALAEEVRHSKADVGLAFDGDGDRCGVVDDTGEEIFADKVGVMLARDFSAQHPGAMFVADVKSTGLFMTDPVLQKNGARTDYWKTGHSYMKRRTHELGALAGFEKSGHFFFNKPVGRGYDDGLISALAICDMLDRNPGKSMSDLKNALPKTWGSPTMSPHCADETKYGVVDAVVKHFQDAQAARQKVAGQPIRDLVTVNGVRVTVEDGTWGLVRASSNKPELVVVVESPVSEARMRDMFKAVDAVLRTHPEVGAYNQTI